MSQNSSQHSSSSGSSSGYTRLADEESLSEVQQRLQQLFGKLRERLTEHAAARTPGSGLLAALTIGTGADEERWHVDTRDGVPPESAVRRIERGAHATAGEEQPSFSLTVPSADDFLALLERRLPPFRALAQRRIVIKGDLSKLRSMAWLLGGADPNGGASHGESAVTVRVLRSGLAQNGGHGEYTLHVEEGATSWTAPGVGA